MSFTSIPTSSLESPADLERFLYKTDANCIFMYVIDSKYKVTLLGINQFHRVQSYERTVEEVEQHDHNQDMIKKVEKSFADVPEMDQLAYRETLSTFRRIKKEESRVALTNTSKEKFLSRVIWYQQYRGFTFISEKHRMPLEELSWRLLENDLNQW